MCKCVCVCVCVCMCMYMCMCMCVSCSLPLIPLWQGLFLWVPWSWGLLLLSKIALQVGRWQAGKIIQQTALEVSKWMQESGSFCKVPHSSESKRQGTSLHNPRAPVRTAYSSSHLWAKGTQCFQVWQSRRMTVDSPSQCEGRVSVAWVPRADILGLEVGQTRCFFSVLGDVYNRKPNPLSGMSGGLLLFCFFSFLPLIFLMGSFSSQLQWQTLESLSPIGPYPKCKAKSRNSPLERTHLFHW